jgi:dTDP-4-amino-4,6-dideoxygalactose transaminase
MRTAARSVPFVDLARQHELLAGELRAAFERVLDANAFILGEEVERFEAEFGAYCGTAHCVGVASGTAALQIMLQATGIGPGDEVIIPAHTFIATALAVLHAGATPVCVDVEQSTGLIDPAAVQAAIGPATAAVLAVHLYGQVCDMDRLRELSANHGVLLLEDAAQAHGATYRNERAGGLGNAAAFSFYPSKNLGALGDGGAICTNDGELSARARQLRDLGRDANGIHMFAGYNERLDGLQAAVLRAKLAHLDGFNDVRRSLASVYRASLDGTSFELSAERSESPSVYHLFPVRTEDRDAIASVLAERGIGTGVHYPRAIPDQPALSGLGDAAIPMARDWAARELSLPLFVGLREIEIDAVVSALMGRT